MPQVKYKGTAGGWPYQRLSEQGVTNFRQCIYLWPAMGSAGGRERQQTSDLSGKLANEGGVLVTNFLESPECMF